jgi:septum site-determining protein MinD
VSGGRAAAELEATGPEAATDEESDTIPDADRTAREATGGRDAGGDEAEGRGDDDIDDELAGSIPFRDDDSGTMNTVLSEEDGDGEADADDGQAADDEQATDDEQAEAADEGESAADGDDGDAKKDGGFFSRLLGR